MYKTKNKFNNSNSQEKRLPPRPKPDFTTDFVDRQKYKLSESEMIQKKAALQSKHREEAIQHLQERRKKLQMGIIDDDTRKVYETALTSKKIDINPSIRRNLSQMIQYERENKRSLKKDSLSEHKQQHSDEEQRENDNEEYQKQLKETQAFIKKFEKAKKMDKIQRAVNLLTDTDNRSNSVKRNSASKADPKKKESQKPIFANQGLSTKILDMKQSNASLNTSTHEQVLSSIEDTIKFMEERLFSSSRIEKIKKQKSQQSFSKQLGLTSNNRTQNMYQSAYSELPSKTSYSYEDQQSSRNHFEKETLQISHLKMNNTDSDQENQCLDTIRRMKDMIDSKQSVQQPNFQKKMKENNNFTNTAKPKIDQLSTLQKYTPHHADSQAQIDFSLTMNNSQDHSLDESLFKKTTPSGQREQYSAQFGGQTPGRSQNDDEQYERIKKSLFEEVNKLQLHSLNNSEQPSFQAKTSIHDRPQTMMDESSIPNLRYNPTPSTNKKVRKTNTELQKLKNQINGTKSIVQSIKVETMQLPNQNQVLGFDFRGSINIKKNIIQK